MKTGGAAFAVLVSLCTFASTLCHAGDPRRPPSMQLPERFTARSDGANVQQGRPSRDRAMELLLTDIVTWLAENFELPASYQPPRLEIVPAKEIASMRYGALTVANPGQAVTPMNDATAVGAAREVLAIYSDVSKTIFLAEGWTGRTAAEISVLVHEMVHHLQRAAGLVYACPAEREKLAYEAQEKWLSQFGTSLGSEFDLDAFTLLATTRCMH